MRSMYTMLQRSIIDDLAAIEQQDQRQCDACGGEDCCCCEIHVDRLKWVDPEQLFEEGMM